MSRVFVVQVPHRIDKKTGKLTKQFDLSSAESFGELVYVLSPTTRPFVSQGVVDEMWKKLFDYSNEDKLLLIGNPALIGFATAIAAAVNFGRVTLLQWNGVKRQYIEIQADLHPSDNLLAELTDKRRTT